MIGFSRGGRAGGGGVQFSKRLDLGGGGRRHRTGLSFKSCQTVFMFPSKVDKKYALATLSALN